MYLSLCPTCSKDYIFLRNNKNIWNEFVSEILDTDIDEDDETIDVSIGARTITFIATHFAEIQEIMELESQDNRAFDKDEAIDTEEDDAEASALTYSMVETVKANGAMFITT